MSHQQHMRREVKVALLIQHVILLESCTRTHKEEVATFIIVNHITINKQTKNNQAIHHIEVPKFIGLILDNSAIPIPSQIKGKKMEAIIIRIIQL